MTTNLNAKAWNFGVAIGEEARKADEIVLRLGNYMEQAATMSARAKAARHELLRYRLTYEKQIKLPETKKRRAVIERQQSLSANFYGAAETFAYYGKRAMECVKGLDELLPHLIAGGEYYNSTGESYGRVSNAVLASSLILSVPEDLRRLVGEFNMHTGEEPYVYLCGGNSELMQLSMNLFDGKYQHRFDPALLDIPYVAGAAAAGELFGALDRAVEELGVSVQRAKDVIRAFGDAKARYFAPELDNPSSWTDQLYEKSAQFRTLSVDYQVVRWTVENVADALFKSKEKVEKSIELARERYQGQQHWKVLQNNLVSAKCKVVAADAIRHSMNKLTGRYLKQSEQDEKTLLRNGQAHKALKEAFDAIPARHRLPSTSFLDNPVRR